MKTSEDSESEETFEDVRAESSRRISLRSRGQALVEYLESSSRATSFEVSRRSKSLDAVHKQLRIQDGGVRIIESGESAAVTGLLARRRAQGCKTQASSTGLSCGRYYRSMESVRNAEEAVEDAAD